MIERSLRVGGIGGKLHCIYTYMYLRVVHCVWGGGGGGGEIEGERERERENEGEKRKERKVHY